MKSKKKTITSHTIVKNEARFVWFAVESVIGFVDKVLLWDTGSSDGTKEILQEIKKRYASKIELNFTDQKSPDEFTKIRQDMLDATETDWFVVNDADEVWWDESIDKVTDFIRRYGGNFESVVVPTINLVGDIYHYQEAVAGNYHLAGKVGHLNLRGVNMSIPGLSSNKPHGTWGWTDKNGKMIQDRDAKKIKYLDAPYMHATFLTRSGTRQGDAAVVKRKKKLKHEIGIDFPKDYYYPESFFRPRPEMVQSPWEVMDTKFRMRAFFETPLRKIKRRLLPKKVGY